MENLTVGRWRCFFVMCCVLWWMRAGARQNAVHDRGRRCGDVGHRAAVVLLHGWRLENAAGTDPESDQNCVLKQTESRHKYAFCQMMSLIRVGTSGMWCGRGQVLLSGTNEIEAVDPEMKTGSGNSAMLLAGKAGQSEIVESLLMYSADVHRMSRAGEPRIRRMSRTSGSMANHSGFWNEARICSGVASVCQTMSETRGVQVRRRCTALRWPGLRKGCGVCSRRARTPTSAPRPRTSLSIRGTSGALLLEFRGLLLLSLGGVVGGVAQRGCR